MTPHCNKRTKTKRVLLVDDEEITLKICEEILSSNGYIVYPFNSGLMAYREFLINEERFDVAVIDLKMPKPDGNLLAKMIKKRRADMPIILFTCSPAEANSSAGYTAVVEKTKTGIEELVEKLNSIFL